MKRLFWNILCISFFCFLFVTPVFAVPLNNASDFQAVQLKDSSIPGLGTPDIFFWPYMSQNESQYGPTSPINVVFVGKTRNEVSDFVRERGMGGFIVLAFDEYGYRGPDTAHMSWDSAKAGPYVPLPTAHLEDGRGLFGSKGRFHLVLIEGGYSKALNANWCYGNIHYDNVIIDLNLKKFDVGHYLEAGAFTKGVVYFKDLLSKKVVVKNNLNVFPIEFGNIVDEDSFFDGKSLVAMWGRAS